MSMGSNDVSYIHILYIRKNKRKRWKREENWGAESEFSSLAVRFIELEQQAAIRHNSIILFFCLPDPLPPAVLDPLVKMLPRDAMARSARIRISKVHSPHSSPHTSSHPLSLFTLDKSESPPPPLHNTSFSLYSPSFFPREIVNPERQTERHKPTICSTSKSTPLFQVNVGIKFILQYRIYITLT